VFQDLLEAHQPRDAYAKPGSITRRRVGLCVDFGQTACYLRNRCGEGETHIEYKWNGDYRALIARQVTMRSCEPACQWEAAISAGPVWQQRRVWEHGEAWLLSLLQVRRA